MNLCRTIAVLLACVAATGCSSKKGSSPTFNMVFSPPGATGYANGSVDAVGFGPSTLDFVLSNALTVTGKVTDGTGTPMNNVDVDFRKTPTSPNVNGDVTNVTGDYTVLMTAGTWVAVVDPGINNLGTLTVTVNIDTPNSLVHNFQFPSPVAVTGVVRELGGPGIANATLEFTGQNTGATASVVADGVGLYSTTLVPDTYEAVVTPVGTPATTHLKQKFTGIVVAGTTTRDFSMTAGVQVNGIVRDNLGQALLEPTDVDIVLPDTSNFFEPATATANPLTGLYSIGPVPVGSQVFEFSAPGDSGFPLQQFTTGVVGPTVQTFDVTLLAGFVLSGVIVQDNGTTLEQNVDVTPLPTNGSLAPDDDTTDNAGVYEISLFPGLYTLELVPDPTNMQVPETRSITIAGNTVLNITLTRGATLMGTVTNGGTPYENVEVQISGLVGASATTDALGAYSFLAPVGTHTLTLTATAGVLKDVALAPQTGVVVTTPGPITQNIALTTATTGTTVVQGTVFGPDGTTPVGGVDIVARDNTTGDVLGRAITTGSGTYILVIP